MVSLAEQLAKSSSRNVNLLSERTRRQAAAESYLFSPKEARQHDLDALHALGVNGFLQLKSLQPEIASFELPLFSESVKSLDRTLQPAAQNAQLDATIRAFLPLLGPFLLDAPTGKVLEWLVRRFRIHEYNVPPIVALFLPYHQTPHFMKMVSLLHIADDSPLRFLQAYKAASKPLHRPLLVHNMLAQPEVARFVVGILPAVLKDYSISVHRALISFHAGVLLEYVDRSKALDENTMSVLLPAAMDVLQYASVPDSHVKPTVLHEMILGSYLILAAISQNTRLTSKAIQSILVAVMNCAGRVSPKQLVRTLVSVCASQDPLEELSGSLIKGLITMPGINAELVDAMAWVGAEKFLNPLIEGLLPGLEDPTSFAIVDSILTSIQLLPTIGYSAASALICRLVKNVSSSGPLPMAWRRLLSQLHQRQPKVVRSASQAIIEEDGDYQDPVEQLLLSISVPISGAFAADPDMATSLIAAANADPRARVIAVRDLVSRLMDDSVSATDIQSLTSMLLLRVHDTSAPVLQALYTTSPEAVAQAFLTSAPNTVAYLDALRQALHGSASKAPRDAIRAHLTFLLSHFLPKAAASSSPSGEEDQDSDSDSNRERAQRVFMDILLPYLLYSKPRMKTAQAVWEILEFIEGSRSVTLELLGGCVDAIKWEQARLTRLAEDKEGNDVDMLTKINLAVAAKIADNILASNYFNANLDGLFEKLHDENPYAYAMTYLVIRALLSRLGGEQRVDAGLRVLKAMKLGTLEGMADFMRGVEEVGNFLDDASVGSAVVLKPNSKNTLHRLQLAVLSVLPNFPRPTGVPLRWLAGDSSKVDVTADEDVRPARYIQLLRAVYRLSNSSASLPLLSAHLLRTLFVNLGDDALAFLVGVWLTAQDRQEALFHIQYAALRHACAFLEAHVASQRTVDFQTVLPAMLVMLQSPDPSVRDATLRCIAVVIKLSSSNEVETVYGFDALYDGESVKLQYLDWGDFQKYMKAIGDNRDNFVHDPEYLQIFHHEHLAQSKGESKKTAGYKQSVLCYLLSHVNACSLLSVKFALLKSVDTVSNEAKAHRLMPTVKNLLSDHNKQDQQLQKLAALVVSVFDISSAVDLNNVNTPTWGIYTELLTMLLENDLWMCAREALLHRLQHGLFAKLSVDRKSQLCMILLRLANEEESSSTVCKEVLANILDDVALIVSLLVSLQPQRNADAAAPPASKRPRVEKTMSNTAHQELSSLAILVEIIGTSKFTSTLELLSCLLDTLRKVTSNVSPDATDRRFVEQLLMSAIENVVENFPPSTTLAPGSIRVDVLVEILRSSGHPQTFHQACLLIASLARVAPDAVLHNVMPVFTFMGSNVFHRDDTYSFRIVQKTVDSIVPVMVAALKEGHGSGMDLYDAAREFLRVFTNAANHIPRHRRVSFFSHLVDTLGPAEFLAPVTMLLVDRVSARIVRQDAAESSATLFLPLAICERYAAEIQLSSFIALVHEVQKLAIIDDPSVHPFLEDTADDEQVHADVASKRRATALLAFCAHALKRLRDSALVHAENERAISQQLLVSLLAVSTSKPDHSTYVEVAIASRSAMASTLGVMSAPDFVAGVLKMLESGSLHAQAGALELLAERLLEVARKTRCMLTPMIVKITETIRGILSTTQETTPVRSALHALTAISNTLAPGEEGAVTAVTPIVLVWLSHQSLQVVALQTLLAFSSTLGPRAIPYLKDIVKACVLFSRQAIIAKSDDPALVPAASNILRNLLTAIPTFWGESEVLSVVELYLDCSHAPVANATELSLLVKTAARRASPHVLLPALCNMWARSLSNSAREQSAKTLAYMQVFKLSIKAASRPAVLENIRYLFKTFLSIFDVCAIGDRTNVQDAVMNAFIEVVVKLNETAFRPLFRKMFDWAFAEESTNRRVVFCHVYWALLDFFKALMVPYMTFTWQAFLEQLRNNATVSPEDEHEWLSVLRTLAKSLSVDEDRVFWRSDKLRQLAPLAIQQVTAAVQIASAESKAAVSDLLTSVLSMMDDDVMIKSLNLDVLMHSRSEDSRVRLFSLTCAEQLWRAHGDKLLGFVAETATFIAEAAEDENDLVVREAHKLKAAVETVGGSIDVA